MSRFEVGARVDAYWNGVWYPGTIVFAQGGMYKVHCDGDKPGTVVTTDQVRVSRVADSAGDVPAKLDPNYVPLETMYGAGRCCSQCSAIPSDYRCQGRSES